MISGDLDFTSSVAVTGGADRQDEDALRCGIEKWRMLKKQMGNAKARADSLEGSLDGACPKGERIEDRRGTRSSRVAAGEVPRSPAKRRPDFERAGSVQLRRKQDR